TKLTVDELVAPLPMNFVPFSVTGTTGPPRFPEGGTVIGDVETLTSVCAGFLTVKAPFDVAEPPSGALFVAVTARAPSAASSDTVMWAVATVLLLIGTVVELTVMPLTPGPLRLNEMLVTPWMKFEPWTTTCACWSMRLALAGASILLIVGLGLVIAKG